MVGCRDGGKNSLDKNYLYLAERLGCDILPEHKAIEVKHHGSGEYTVTVRKLTGFLNKGARQFRSKGVVVAAGVIGTLELLMKSREKGGLPDISDKLGHMVRTNSEVLLGLTVKDRDEDLCNGVSITSGLFVNDNTHIELVRYPKGSDLMGLLGIPLTDGGGGIPRVIRLIFNVFRHPVDFLRTLLPFGWAKRSIILLVMQTLDNHITLHRKRRWWTLFRKSMVSQNRGRKIPAYIREANEAARFMSDRMNGIPQNAISEVLLNIPMTAHILGGCIMGVDEKSGVIDKYHRVFNYDNLYVVDGSAMPANLGVNPSLTITAMSERAMSYIPTKTVRDKK
jgi:cholesterol oxidase